MTRVVSAKHRMVPCVSTDGRPGFLDRTEVVIDDNGKVSLNVYEGHLPLSQGGEGFFKAAYEKRQRPGFYRVEG